MLINYIKKLKLYFLLFLLLTIEAVALSSIDISQEIKGSILKESNFYLDKDNNLTVKELIEGNVLKPYNKSQINVGLANTSIWINFKLTNNSSSTIEKLLILTSPLPEDIELYTNNNLDNPTIKGVAHKRGDRKTLCYSYKIKLDAGQTEEYYVKVKSKWGPNNFSIIIENEEQFYKDDIQQQLVISMLLAMIFILMIYSFILFFYTKDKSYLYYSFYLLTLLYQQASYLGLTQLYLPQEYVIDIEIKLALFKVTIMLISSSLFAIFFLKTKEMPLIHNIYKGFILIAFFELIILNIPGFYNLNIPVLTASLLIIFNLVAAVLSYRNGNQQARLYILGFGIVFGAYTIMITDALGLTSLVYLFPNILIWTTTVEALILSLAFADRYNILQSEKAMIDKNREQIIKNEVIEKTALLNQALKAKELLIQEVHHRIKNNLQIILSMVRLQSDKITDNSVVEKFKKLENRINAIAKTYNLLLLDNNLDAIDMEEYIDSLLLDMEESMCESDCNIEVKTDIDAVLPLRESVYIGIIINELVTNAHKYAFGKQGGKIFISLKQKENRFTLIIRDNGRGFIYDKENKSLGLKLIHSLVLQQLRGDIEMLTENLTQYSIRFTL
jgi:two-component sensor histidine kinase